jgi:hypothetical protein
MSRDDKLNTRQNPDDDWTRKLFIVLVVANAFLLIVGAFLLSKFLS